MVIQATGSTREKSKVKAPCFRGSLNPEDLLDWVGNTKKYFEWKEIEDPHRVRFTCTRLKGHATRWWEYLQKDRVLKREEKVTTWKEMVKRIKGKFLPLFKEFQNLRQKDQTMLEYTDEFFRLSIRVVKEKRKKNWQQGMLMD